jgi:hypothetical protein
VAEQENAKIVCRNMASGWKAVKFHFQVRTGTHVMLTEAGDFSNSDEARVEAAKRIGLLLHEHAGNLWVDEDWQMDVTDERGLILFVINVSAMRSSATHN